MKRSYSDLKEKLYLIIFEANTPAGKAFDIFLLWTILISVIAVCIESLPNLDQQYLDAIRILEWTITIIFTIEYITRIMVVKKKYKYIFSFYGMVDLLSIIPTYLSVIIPYSQFSLVIRVFRLLRIFRVLKLGRYLGESYTLLKALKESRYKITVFLEGVLVVVVIIGTLMYLIEGEASGFDSIPHSIYWAIVTLTTVGYGDIAPVTPLGRMVASFVMLLGYGVIAVPTGIVTAELVRPAAKNDDKRCKDCEKKIPDQDAIFCKHCGGELEI